MNIEFTPPKDWNPPAQEDLDEEGYFEAIVRCQIRNRKVRICDFDGEPVGSHKKDSKDEDESEGDRAEPAHELQSMVDKQTAERGY